MTTLNARANQAYQEYVERMKDCIVNEQHTFEEIAEALVTAADELDMPPTVEWLALRDWFKDLLHETAAVVRQEVSS